MLTETVLLSLCGGALGLVLARWGIHAVVAVAPPIGGLGSALRIDGPVLWFAFAASALTGICFGLVPAAHGSKPDLNTVLKGAASASAATPRSRLLSGLVITEVALALVLLIGGGLLLKSFGRMLQVDLGIRTEGLLTFQLGLSGSKYQSAQRRAEFFRTLLERLRLIPGVRDASAVSPLPLSGAYQGGEFQIDGRRAPARGQNMRAQYCSAAPGYFRIMGVPVLLGREFEERDQNGASAVVIINHALARRFFQCENPVGQRIDHAQVIGVVGDVRHNGPAKELDPQIYSPLLPSSSWGAAIVVRTAGDPMKLAGLVREEVRALDRDLPLDRLKSMQQVVSDSIAGARLISSIPDILT
jgi:predicted permease